MRENVSVIYGGSNDPVFIKKIALRLWTLRDELEAVIHKRLQHLDPQTDPKKAIADLLEEYSAKTPNAQVIPIKSEEAPAEMDPLEAEMAAAIAGSSAPAGEAEVDPFEAAMAQAMDGNEGEEAPATDDAEAAAAEMLGTGTVSNAPIEEESAATAVAPSNVSELYQRRPQLPTEKVINGKTVMAEVGMDEIYFFCSQKLLVGQSIVIEFQIPKRFRLCAEVRYCRQYNMKSRIISENALPYRAVAKWTYLRPGERTLLRQFIESIEPVIPHQQLRAPAKPKEESGDDFDELDDLDL